MERSVKLRKKIKFENTPTKWSHHRGGWACTFETLQSELYAPDGVLCISAVEEWICDDKLIDQPWIGFVHQVPRNNYRFYPDLERLVKSEIFAKSLDKCYGLFVLSDVVKRYLIKNLGNKKIPVVRILYPITPFPMEKKFHWDKFHQAEQKQVVFVGEFLRNYQAFFELAVPQGFQKCLLKAPDVKFEELLDCNMQRVTLNANDSVLIKNRVSNEEYDDMLSSSIVFLNLYDAPANTTVIECLGRNTPLIVNRLPGIEEYLGSRYPLFYDTLEEATSILHDRERLKSGSEYLKNHSIKAQLTHQCFLDAFVSSSVYRLLPLPPSQQHDNQQTKFPQFDLTVVVCSYKRVYNLQNLLECFKKQDYGGTFEIILWNNNVETQEQVACITAPYQDTLNIRLIQSSENYYCIIRLAVVRLMRSNILLICDDDIVPAQAYISTFMAKYKQHGPRAVLCCRGHVFGQHILNEENPHKFWEDYEHMRFFDEKAPERQVCYNSYCQVNHF